MEPTTTTGLSVFRRQVKKIGGLFDGVGAVRDDDAVGFVFVEDLVNRAHQSRASLCPPARGSAVGETASLVLRRFLLVRATAGAVRRRSSRLPASMYQARSRRSLPTESMVPPVKINATLGKLAMKNPSSFNIDDVIVIIRGRIQVQADGVLKRSNRSSRSRP